MVKRTVGCVVTVIGIVLMTAHAGVAYEYKCDPEDVEQVRSSEWEMWTGEQPSYEDVIKTAGEFALGVLLELRESNILVHIASAFDAKSIITQLRVKTEKSQEDVVFPARISVGDIPAKRVLSYFAPILVCKEGVFEVEAEAKSTTDFGFFKQNSLFLIADDKGVRGLRPREYLNWRYETVFGIKIDEVQKPITDYYKPSTFAWPLTDIPPGAEVRGFEQDPVWKIIVERMNNANIRKLTPSAPNFKQVNEADVEDGEGRLAPISPRSKVCYTFKGRFVVKHPHYGTYVGVKWASVYVYDDDVSSDDDKICSTITDANGNFECSGCHNDFWGDPDPYINIYLRHAGFADYPGDGGVDVEDCDGIDETWTFNFYNFEDDLDGGTYDVGARQPAEVSGERACWIYNFINMTWAKNVLELGTNDIGPKDEFEVCFPEDGAYYNWSDDTINIPNNYADSPAVIAHEFGHALMDELYGYDEYPLPGGNHNFCGANQHKGLALSEGFATANVFFSFDTSWFCWDGLPWDPSFHIICVDLEPSTVHVNYDNPNQRWNNHFCGDLQCAGVPCGQRNEAYVSSAILDLLDAETAEDRKCSEHVGAGRNACDATDIPGGSGSLVSSPLTWKQITDGVKTRKPSEFSQLADELTSISDACPVDLAMRFNSMDFALSDCNLQAMAQALGELAEESCGGCAVYGSPWTFAVNFLLTFLTLLFIALRKLTM